MQQVDIQNVFEAVEMGSLMTGSVFLWNGHMYVVHNPEAGQHQATRVAGYWTNNPDDRWIAKRNGERFGDKTNDNSENFNPCCMVWWMRHNPVNP